MATHIENGAWGGVCVIVDELNQRTPKRLVYRRKAVVECGIAKKGFPLNIVPLQGHRCEEHLRASVSPAVGSIPKGLMKSSLDSRKFFWSAAWSSGPRMPK